MFEKRRPQCGCGGQWLSGGFAHTVKCSLDAIARFNVATEGLPPLRQPLPEGVVTAVMDTLASFRPVATDEDLKFVRNTLEGRAGLDAVRAFAWLLEAHGTGETACMVCGSSVEVRPTRQEVRYPAGPSRKRTEVGTIRVAPRPARAGTYTKTVNRAPPNYRFEITPCSKAPGDSVAFRVCGECWQRAKE